MPDNHTPEQRHRNMAAVRASSTKPEIALRNTHHEKNNGIPIRLAPGHGYSTDDDFRATGGELPAALLEHTERYVGRAARQL
jgi:hypothetical protein